MVSGLDLGGFSIINVPSTAVAIFDVPVMATVSEGEPEVSVCVVMTTNPPQANIASEVEVYLTTADGTGIAKGSLKIMT